MSWPTSLRQKLLDGILEIVQEFDYTRVHKVMAFLDWRYAFIDSTPSINELKSFSVDQIIDCANKAFSYKSKCTTECGGFRVTIDPDEKNFYIRLSFSLTSWEYGDQG